MQAVTLLGLGARWLQAWTEEDQRLHVATENKLTVSVGLEVRTERARLTMAGTRGGATDFRQWGQARPEAYPGFSLKKHLPPKLFSPRISVTSF